MPAALLPLWGQSRTGAQSPALTRGSEAVPSQTLQASQGLRLHGPHGRQAGRASLTVAGARVGRNAGLAAVPSPVGVPALGRQLRGGAQENILSTV